MVAKKGNQGYSQGPSTDASNTPVIDPSENVKALQIAAAQRQDDLRHADRMSSRREMRLQINALRREMNLRAKYDKMLRKGESQRLDAIRSVDVASGVRSAEVADTAVQALAAQVPIIAEQVRTNLASTVGPILTQLAEVQRAQYEQQGLRAGGVESKSDAAELANILAPMVENLRLLNAAQEQRTGATARTSNQQAQLYAGMAALAAVAGIAGHFIK